MSEKRTDVVETPGCEPEPFSIDELVDIHRRALDWRVDTPNVHWQRAIMALMDAADRLHTMYRRSEEEEGKR